METKSNAVVSLTDHKINSRAKIELDGVRRSLSMLPWDLEVQQVLTFAGLPVSEIILSESVALQSNSEASQLGHQTLNDLVTKSEQEDGLGLDWDEFSKKMSALVGKQKYSINERDYREINALIHDATVIIGRKPSDVGEFHGAKQKALEDKVTTMEREFKTRSQDIQEKNTELMRSLTEAQGEVSDLHDSNKRMMKDAADRITSMNREMAMNQEVFEQKSNDRIKEEAYRIECEFKEKMAVHRAELSREIDEANSRRVKAELAVADIQLKVDRGELISAEVLAQSEKYLDEARASEVSLRNQLLSMNTKLTESEKVMQSLRDENHELIEQVSKLTSHAATLEVRMREVIEDKLGSSEFAVLQERLSIVRAEKIDIEGTLNKERKNHENEARKFSELRGRFQQMKQVGHDQFRILNDNIKVTHEKNIALAERLTRNKIVIGMLSITSLASVAAIAYLMA